VDPVEVWLKAVCTRNRLGACPPEHTFPNGTKVHRTDKEKFPFEAYHYYCVPGNARFAESPYEVCDPYSNPQPQEILQILPHPVWEQFGYPTKKGQGWIGDPRTWELDVGKLSQSLFFYQVFFVLLLYIYIYLHLHYHEKSIKISNMLKNAGSRDETGGETLVVDRFRN